VIVKKSTGPSDGPGPSYVLDDTDVQQSVVANYVGGVG